KTMPNSSLHLMLRSLFLSSERCNGGLPPFIQGIDSEQTFQQLELRNVLTLPVCTKEVVKISSEKHPDKSRDKNQNIKQKNTAPVDLGSAGDDSQESDESGDSEEESAMLNSIKKRLAEKSAGEDEIEDFSVDEDELDFDFQLDNEISKSVSDDEDDGINIKGVRRKLPDKLVKKRVSVVDDKFFKLSEAEQFLDSEDLKEEKRKKKEERGKDKTVEEDDDDDEEGEDDGEDIDIFGELDSDDDAQGAKYGDFFDPPDDASAAEASNEKANRSQSDLDDSELNPEDENVASSDDDDEEEEEEVNDEEEVNEEEEMSADEQEMSDNAEELSNDEGEMSDVDEEESVAETKGDKKKKTKESTKTASTLKENDKKVTFSNDLLQSDDETEKPLDAKSPARKSTFELKQEKLQAKAREMEEQSLKEASWELTGEVSSSKRPENSLLDTVLDFQHTAKAAPVITDETTKSLEDYIKQRIRDKTFDDVERKEKPKEDVFEFKKRIVLDQEKSKLSLGELYEQEFVKQQQTETDEVKADPECEKIEKELNKLFHQLDALSNYRYTPMRPGTEVKIIVNTPAITMEEVAPVATADSELLAPEEVYGKKKGELKAADERSATDKKRALRQKKKDKRERKKAKESREKVVAKLKPGLGNKHSKVKALKQLEQISKVDKNITLIKGDQKKTSSTTFFTQLQEEVQTNAKSKKAAKDKKKKVVDASKLML
ncbi:unnamed protein product, partial [Candidula unifasciata]